MSKISWCKKQSKGISIIEPNIILSNSYMKEAEETLDAKQILNEDLESFREKIINEK